MRAPLAAAALTAVLCLPSRAAQLSAEVESEVQLESAQEARLQGVLRRVLGSEDVLVIVDMDVDVQSKPRMTELLPGVPIKDTPAAAEMSPLTNASVKSINATVMLDDSIPADADALVQKTAEQVLSLDLSRGDAVAVKRMRLRTQLTSARPTLKDWLGPGPIVSLLWLAAAVGMAGLVFGRFLNPLLGVLREARAAPAAAQPPVLEMGRGSAVAGQPAETAPAPALPPPTPADEDLPFSFLRERHAPMLKFLLRRAPAKTAAVIVHYLPSRLAVEVLGELPADTRRDVAKAMSRVVQLEEENVRQIEDSLRSRIDYLMGGEDRLAEILDQAPPTLQEEMLAAVRGEEPEAAERLGRRIVRLDDLAFLDAEGLKTLSRRIPIRSLATVLRSSEELKDRVLPKLTSGLGAWLSQEIELASVLGGDRLAVEQKKVLAVLAQLVREGAVKLERPAGPAALAHEPAPAAEA